MRLANLVHDPVADMKRYDKLPKTVRRFLANAVVSYSATQAYAVWKKVGAKKTIETLKRMEAFHANSP